MKMKPILPLLTLLITILLLAPLTVLATDYPHVTAEPQKTGWPLTDEERTYVLKPEYERRPGHESNKHLTQLWSDQTKKAPDNLKQVDVYLLGGQSNMQGVGKVSELPAEIPKEIPYTYFWTGEKFEPLVLGQTKISTRITDFGPEVGFALNIASAERPVYLIKYHASGMPLHHGWNGNNWEGGEPAPGRRNFYPGEKSDDANIGTLYVAMRNQFQAGVKHLSSQGFTPTVRGFLWMQGEQDSKHEVSASKYATSLKRLRQRLADDMKSAPDLPLVFGQVLPHDPPLARFSHRQEIREQMAACDSSSNKPEAMKNTKMVSTDGYTLLPDTVHYDAAGQLRLGKAFAAAMKQLHSGVPAKEAPSVPRVSELKVPESSLSNAHQFKDDVVLSPSTQNPTLRVMTFNILQGAEDAGNVGFDNVSFGGSRLDEIAEVIKLAQADVVGVQEDCTSDKLLKTLGNEWQRIGTVYSRLPLKKISVDPYLTVVAVEFSGREDVTLVNCHWFPPRGGYGPDLAQVELKANSKVEQSEAVAKRIIEKCSIPNGARGYNATLKPLKAAIESGKTVILTGDFNEPSHLDWTERYAKEGSDRWVKNSTGIPLRFAVKWPGSTQLADAGLIDSYRMIHSDEVKHTGITWTPIYPENTPGRRPYNQQVLDRIDRVYHSGNSLKPFAAEVVGEANEVADIVYPGRWPSDHRAVVVTFKFQ